MPPTLSLRTAAENDSDHVELGRLPAENVAGGLGGLESLMRRYPDDWALKVLHASYLLRSPDVQRAEAKLRGLIQNPPVWFEGHSRLGTFLKYQPGRRGEAMAVYEESLQRWPWNHQGADACMWLVTEGMTQFPEARIRAA